jgi:mRNA-degrading endonuclease RelE of RelBE toxin-antitoxin system
MSHEYPLTMKPCFQAELLALEPRYSHQVLEKLNLLASDPRPDGSAKKRLKHVDGTIFRLRCGDFRIVYTFDLDSRIRARLKSHKRSRWLESCGSRPLGHYP